MTDDLARTTSVYERLDKLMAEVHPKNPKDHDIGLIAESIERFGFLGAVTKDAASNTLVAGHGRLKALAAIRRGGGREPEGIQPGWGIPVRYEHFADETERDAYLLADNQTTIRGGWREGELTDFLTTLAESDSETPLRGTGFDADDLDALLADRSWQPEPPPVGASTKIYKGERFGITVNVEDQEQEDRLVAMLDGHGFWVKRHSR